MRFNAFNRKQCLYFSQLTALRGPINRIFTETEGGKIPKIHIKEYYTKKNELMQ